MPLFRKQVRGRAFVPMKVGTLVPVQKSEHEMNGSARIGSGIGFFKPTGAIRLKIVHVPCAVTEGDEEILSCCRTRRWPAFRNWGICLKMLFHNGRWSSRTAQQKRNMHCGFVGPE
jgi:hypothetical protein